MLHNFTQEIEPLLIHRNAWMLLKMKIPQILQIAADGIGHQASGRGDEIHAQPGGAVTDAPFGVLQLVIVQVKQQASVVVKHRGHFLNLHGIVLVENAKIAAVAVGVQDQSIQNAHPAEGIAAADALKVFQKNGNGSVLGQNSRLGKAQRFTGEKRAFGDQRTMIEPQIIGHSIRTETGCQLESQLF